MNNCAFTIVAKNYIGLASILEKSIHAHSRADIDFYILVADELRDSGTEMEYPSNVLEAGSILGLDRALWQNMSFKYNLTEFCTAIKPAAMLYFMDQGYEKIMYLDPDICFFSSIDLIFSQLDDCCMMLTPHILTVPALGKTDSPESAWRTCGIFNLGFCGVKDTGKTREVLNWWHDRLVDQSFEDVRKAQYTDQKMADFFPAFFTQKELCVSRSLGMNVAPWNFFEREIVEDGGTLYVKKRKSGTERKERLIFVHFSGYDYVKLSKRILEQRNISRLREYPDTDILFSRYAAYLSAETSLQKYINLAYTYSTFKNGIKITDYHRRLFSSLMEKGETYAEPFSPIGPFYRLLERKGMITRRGDDFRKATRNTFPNFSKKLRILNRFSRCIYRMIGTDRYFLFVRLLRSYSAYETHIHLLDAKYDSDNLS